MDNFVTAKIYRLAAWTKPLPQPAQRELRLAFPKVSGSRWSDRHTTRGVLGQAAFSITECRVCPVRRSWMPVVIWETP
jgi:hypothetical protein